MSSANQHSSQRRLPGVGTLVGAALVYLAIAVIPPQPFERPLRVMRLWRAAVPDQVAVPVERMAARDLRDSWGNARSGGRRHEGIDLFAPRGTHVLSATDGMIWRVGDDPLGGRVVWVLGPGGQMHYYAHLDHVADVHAGDPVAVGETLGAVGTTGNARGGPPHLHYGIYVRGAAINPYPLLVGRTRDTRMPDRAPHPQGSPGPNG